MDLKARTGYATLTHIGATTVVLALSLGVGCGAQQASPQTAEVYYIDPSDEQSSADEASSDEALADVRPPVRPQRPAGSSKVLVRRSPTSSGPLDGDRAGRVIYQNSERFEQCHAGMGSTSSTLGVVFVIIDVDPQGNVTNALIGHSDVRNTPFIECVGNELGELSMPATGGSSVIQAYLVFGARDEEQGRQMLRAYRAARADTDDGPARFTAVRRSVQGCYERLIPVHEALVGRIVLGLTLRSEGHVETVEITEENLDGRLDACVVSAVSKLQLDVAESEGSRINYPIVMYPGR